MGVPHNVFIREVSPRILDCPKSVILYLETVTTHIRIDCTRTYHIVSIQQEVTLKNIMKRVDETNGFIESSRVEKTFKIP